jgi:hypothetical protein
MLHPHGTEAWSAAGTPSADPVVGAVEQRWRERRPEGRRAVENPGVEVGLPTSAAHEHGASFPGQLMTSPGRLP